VRFLFITFFGQGDATDKQCNHLFLPASASLKAGVQIGERRWPAVEGLQGLGMLFRRLFKAISSGDYHSPSIDRKAFGSRSFIYAQDLETAPDVQR